MTYQEIHTIYASHYQAKHLRYVNVMVKFDRNEITRNKSMFATSSGNERRLLLILSDSFPD